MRVLDVNLAIFADHTHVSLLWGVPIFLRRLPLDIVPRKRRRRCGNRGGVIVNIKIFMRTGCWTISNSLPRPLDLASGHFTALKRLTLDTRWLRPIVSVPLAAPSPASPVCFDQEEYLLPQIIIRPCWEGSNTANLCPDE
ncbi:hypothetical protein Q8A67_022824 [Cirrhinus molitorella]|uniref:Uncharacterized protein n=1 Tax=Cirrhinus molitorella TaxID=172907 RepID=A0AA88TCI5_9TELE|nr:hypothetical protein Q8A67_022824 [Cirrhinus molitorella]